MDSGVFRKSVVDWYQTRGRSLPWRTNSLDVGVGLLTEVLLRKTSATQVLNVYDDFLRLLQKSTSILSSEMETVLRPLGLQRQRTKAILSIIKDINIKFGCETLPDDLDALLQLPHIGPYIANATRCFYFELPVPIVDCNIARVFGRFFGIKRTGANPVREKVYWIVAASLVDRDSPREYNWGLLDIAAAICTNLNPRCNDCPLLDGCHFAGNLDWRGLSSVDAELAGSTMWFGNGINQRFAEIAGLPGVFSDKRIERLGQKHSVDCTPDQVVSELELRYLAVVEYCPGTKEELEWTYWC